MQRGKCSNFGMKQKLVVSEGFFAPLIPHDIFLHKFPYPTPSTRLRLTMEIC